MPMIKKRKENACRMAAKVNQSIINAFKEYAYACNFLTLNKTNTHY
jgi:hypothetical protein